MTSRCPSNRLGRRLASSLALAVALAAPTSGTALAFSETNAPADLIDPSQISSVHNALYKVPDGVVSWDTLAGLKVESEVQGPLRAVFTTSYSDEIEALDGTEVKLMGFLFPLEGGLEHKRFLLTAWPPSCPFCLPAGPTHMVEVFCDEPVEFSEGAIVMAGRFEVLRDDPSGLYYRLHESRMEERFDDIRWTGAPPAQPKAPKN
jgi:uncharacterized protein